MLTFDALRDELYPRPDPWLDDPAGWVTHRLGERLWSAQVAILESVRDHRRTAVHSCHGAGKSYVAARAACWWLETHPPGDAFVVSTAPSGDQVKAILWREIGKAHRKGRLVGRVNLTEWYIGQEIVAYGRKPSDYDENSFQGIHAPFVLVVVDEASGIPETLWLAILSLLTTSDCRVLATGNPDYEGSRFAKMCAPDSGWNAIHIDGLATPNFTDEALPPGAPLLDQTWIDDLVADYGVDSPPYQAKVRGLFPADRSDGIIPWSWAHRSRGVEAVERAGPLRVPVELGVDVGGGGDLTVIRERQGPVAGRVWRLNTDRAEQIVDALTDAIAETQASAVKVDVGGIGFAVPDFLRSRLRVPVSVAEVNFGAKAKDPARFTNVRAELWWEGRERSKLGAGGPWDLTAADERTMADLTAPRWFEAKDGRIQVEAKDEVRRRLGRSPDDGDALLLAFYDPPNPTPDAVMTRYRSSALRGTR